MTPERAPCHVLPVPDCEADPRCAVYEEEICWEAEDGTSGCDPMQVCGEAVEPFEPCDGPDCDHAS